MLAEAENFDGGLEDPTADPDSVTTSVISDMSVATRSNVAPSKLIKSIGESAILSMPEDMGNNVRGMSEVASETTDVVIDNLEKVRKTAANTVGLGIGREG